MNNNSFNFWYWFFHGSGGKPGFRRLVNSWLVIHLLVGTIVAIMVHLELATASNTVLLPLAGILIGLSFAWAGNAQALLQSSEIEKLAEYHEGGFSDYVYAYQTAILAILITLICWGLAGLRVFDDTWPTAQNMVPYNIVKISLFTIISLTIRECWQVVISAQWLLIARREIRNNNIKTS